MANGVSNSHWNKLRDVKNCDSNPPISPRERIVMHPVCMYDALFPGMVSMSSKWPAMELDRGEFKATEKEISPYCDQNPICQSRTSRKSHVRNDFGLKATWTWLLNKNYLNGRFCLKFQLKIRCEQSP